MSISVLTFLAKPNIKAQVNSAAGLEFISVPVTIIFLTCDAYGVLPPVAKLSIDQAMYHFISGYTAKVAGTERGITEPVATFSPCFGGPFLTLHPLRYAELLKEKINQHKSNVYLVNTGWIGGSSISGAKRISIQSTRTMIAAILNGSIENSEFQIEPIFGLSCPTNLEGVNSNILDPRIAWNNQSAYDSQAEKLAEKWSICWSLLSSLICFLFFSLHTA